ncbi:MAG: hypothetical protein L0Z71_04750 [Anaerolineae bacterium]|nr:hypothetical protein [Anaerolineae bacterium]
MSTDSRGNPVIFEEPLFIALFVAVNIVISLLGFVLYAVGTSSVMLGILRSEEGIAQLHFQELFNDGRKYLWRILGVMLLISLGVSAIFFALFACMALFGAVTAGIGFICIQPLFIILYPIMMLLYAVIEQSQAAVVADDMGVVDAITRGWNLVKENFWRFLLISLVIYIGLTLISSIIMLPFMVPFFFIPFLIENPQFDLSSQSIILFVAAFSMILLPVMALVQGITITFMKAAYMLLYLRLTRGSTSQPELQTVTA